MSVSPWNGRLVDRKLKLKPKAMSIIAHGLVHLPCVLNVLRRAPVQVGSQGGVGWGKQKGHELREHVAAHGPDAGIVAAPSAKD
jgi:hypothetical protein